MMGFSNLEQLQELFLCAGAGFLLGAYYELFRLWRVWFPSSPIAVFVQDCLFFISSAFGIFLLALAITDGALRVYVFAGLIAGFFAYRHTVGRWCRRAAVVLHRKLSGCLHCIAELAKRGLSKLKKDAKKRKKSKKGLETEPPSIV